MPLKSLPPTGAPSPPAGPAWLHEIKHNGLIASAGASSPAAASIGPIASRRSRQPSTATAKPVCGSMSWNH